MDFKKSTFLVTTTPVLGRSCKSRGSTATLNYDL